jgi:hypothetical protein
MPSTAAGSHKVASLNVVIGPEPPVGRLSAKITPSPYNTSLPAPPTKVSLPV